METITDTSIKTAITILIASDNGIILPHFPSGTESPVGEASFVLRTLVYFSALRLQNCNKKQVVYATLSSNGRVLIHCHASKIGLWAELTLTYFGVI